MIARYKNKKIFRAVLPGIFLAGVGLLYCVGNVFADTLVKVRTETAGSIGFPDQATELDIYRNHNLYFKYTSSSDNTPPPCYVSAILDGYNYNDGNNFEINHPVAPGVYNFHIECNWAPGAGGQGNVYWRAWIGYKETPYGVDIFDKQLPYVKISPGQRIAGTITVGDVGQTTRLERFSGDNQTYYYGLQFPQKMVAKAVRSDGQPISGKQVAFSLKSGPQFGQASFTNPSATTGADGTVETFFTLTGPVTATPFIIKAYCADCGLQQEALFTERLQEKTDILQKLPDGDNQTWLIGETLPKQLSVKVVDSQYNPIDGVDIKFSVSMPLVGNWSFPGNLKEITVKTVQGIATTGFKLGTASGDYSVAATCAICANIVSFSEKAVTMNGMVKLTPEIAEMSGIVGQELPNKFKVYAYNIFTQQKENHNVSFTLLTSPLEEAQITSQNNATDKEHDYFATAKLKLGSVGKRYTVRAYCADCLGGQEVLCYGFAHQCEVPIETDEEPMANPDSRDPNTNEPLTPMIRVKRITTDNDNNSFTTYESENHVALEAEVLPTDWAQGATVKWTLEDSPTDNYVSPIPSTLPGDGRNSSFKVDITNPADGIGFPLRYRITATAVNSGREVKEVISKPRAIKQDEIDKCRQEYIDFDTGRFGPLSATPIRSAFTLGVTPDPDNPYLVKYKDCLAHIKPSRTKEAKDLKAAYPGTGITSGYRSPRKNWDIYKNKIPTPRAAWTSWHMFGNAVDLDYLPHTGANWKQLWDAAVKPKILEDSNAIPMIYMKTTDDEVKRGSAYPASIYQLNTLFDMGNCLHLGE